ncbi:MAG TPA: ceramidase domain-containing protein [Cytophagales bacterium]|nr:ceramidase domain-containing protein [Cytophagales bacterium]
MQRQDIEWLRYNISLADGGPYYAETDPHNYLVEPWNAFSSLFYLIPAIFWAIKIRHHLKENLFLAYCIPLLILGGLGSTLFHAFRSSSILLYMDILPILLLTFSVSTYFWQKVYNNWWLTIFTLLLCFLIRLLSFTLDLPIHTLTNIAYAINGVVIFLPIVIVLIRNSFQRVKIILFSILLFATALFFREIDARSFEGLPMGTHFLWHIFSAAGAYFLAEYLYFTHRIELKAEKIKPKEDKHLMQASSKKENGYQMVR